MILSNTDQQVVNEYKKSNTVIEGDWWSVNDNRTNFNELSVYRSTIKKNTQ
jgi:hypothetical protein